MKGLMRFLREASVSRRGPSAHRFQLGLVTAWLVMVLSVSFSALADSAMSATAERPTTWSNEGTAAPIQVAPVTIDGRVLFMVRGVTAFPANRRAGRISERIRAFAQSGQSVETLNVRDTSDGSAIMAADQPIMTLFEADAVLEGVRRPVLATAYSARIAEAVTAYRTERAPEALLWAGLYTLGATLLSSLLAWGLVRGFRTLGARCEGLYGARAKGVHFQQFSIVSADQLRNLTLGFLRFARILSLLVLAYLYSHFVLALYPWTRATAAGLSDLVLHPVTEIWTGLVDYLPNLVFLVLFFFIARYLIKLGRLFFDSLAEQRLRLQGFDSEWAWPTYRIVRVLIIVFAVVVAYPYIPGSDTDAFKGVTIFLGVIVSLGSSTIIANIIAGYTMTYRRAFRVGEFIKVQEQFGQVEEMRLLVTHLRTPKNEEVVIPNSVILNNEVTNYSSQAKNQGIILHTTVGIGYEVPWRQVEAMLLMAAERTEHFLREPSPFVLQKLLGDYAIVYELNAYTRDASTLPAQYDDLHRNIVDVFNEYGVAIMTPSYEQDPPQPKLVPPEKWYAAPATPPAQEAGAKGAT